MIATTRPRRSAELRRRPFRWLAALALFALTPKCLLCLAAYAGMGVALGVGGREICGGSAGGMEAWVASILMTGAALGFIALWMRRRLALLSNK